MVKYILAFFAASDGIVSENIMKNFYTEVKVPEIRYFYAFQNFIENVHSEVYSLLIDTLVSDEQEKVDLFNAVSTIPVIGKKAEWAKKYLESDCQFSERLIAFICVEGI